MNIVTFAVCCALALNRQSASAPLPPLFGVISTLSGEVKLTPFNKVGVKGFRPVPLKPDRDIGKGIRVGDKLSVGKSGKVSLFTKWGAVPVQSEFTAKELTQAIRATPNRNLELYVRVGGVARGENAPVLPASEGAVRSRLNRVLWNPDKGRRVVKISLLRQGVTIKSWDVKPGTSPAVSEMRLPDLPPILAGLQEERNPVSLVIQLAWSAGAKSVSRFSLLSKGRDQEVSAEYARFNNVNSFAALINLHGTLADNQLKNDAFDLALAFYRANPKNEAALDLCLSWAKEIGDKAAQARLTYAKKRLGMGANPGLLEANILSGGLVAMGNCMLATKDFAKQLDLPCRYVTAASDGQVTDGADGKPSPFAQAFVVVLDQPTGSRSFLKLEDITAHLRASFAQNKLPTQPVYGYLGNSFGGFVWMPAIE